MKKFIKHENFGGGGTLGSAGGKEARLLDRSQEGKRSGCKASIINKFLNNFAKLSLNENSPCPPVFCSSDFTHPFTSPVLLTRGQRVCNAVACAPPFRPQLVRAPLKGGEKESSPHPSPIGEGSTHVAHSHNIRRAAFTLAEVLITLGIIGVVAAITIPALMSQYKDMVAKQQFKRAYSVIQQAFQAVYADEEYNYSCYYWDKNPYPSSVCVERNDAGICIKSELPDGSPLPSDYMGGTTECKTFTAAVEKHLNIIKKCEGSALKNGCIPKYAGLDTYNKQQDDTLTDDMALQKASGCDRWTQSNMENNCTAYVLSDGTIILLYGTSFRLFAIDINGMKGPNKWGHDLFSFGSRGNLNKPPYVATDLSCNPTEKGGRSTSVMLKHAYK